MDSEDDWHEALRRGRWVETPLQLAEQIGVPMNEDVGTLADINAAVGGVGLAPIPLALGKFGTDLRPPGSAMISSSRSSRGSRPGRSPGSRGNESPRRTSRPTGDTPPPTVST